jgi:hypothetical protein
MPQPPCRFCARGQQISTFTFVLFAGLLAMAAMEPDQTLLRRVLLWACSALSAVAVFRFAIARLLTRNAEREVPTTRSVRRPAA